jgi:hypothetical protein
MPEFTFDPISYPEPFSAEVVEHPEPLVDSVTHAHAVARSEWGDEGEGYDMNLMTQVLLDEGWTPPAPLPPTPAVQVDEVDDQAPVEDHAPHLWIGAEGGRSSSHCHYLFALAYPDRNPDAYLSWKRHRTMADLRTTYATAMERVTDPTHRARIREIGERFRLDPQEQA